MARFLPSFLKPKSELDKLHKQNVDLISTIETEDRIKEYFNGIEKEVMDSSDYSYETKLEKIKLFSNILKKFKENPKSRKQRKSIKQHKSRKQQKSRKQRSH
jgi:hypothetical protein